MATLESIAARVRMEIGDTLESFADITQGDDETTRFELTPEKVNPGSLVVRTSIGDAPYVQGVDYEYDAEENVVELMHPLMRGVNLSVRGESYKFFSDEEIELFVRTAASQHLHNREGVTLTTLPPVEDYLIALLASIEALYVLLNDAAFDIDVSSPEGVGIPRSQRFRQLQEMIELRKQQYQEMAGALNVGLNRIEVFSLRRVSRETGRLVPVYKPQELEDRQPPQRVFLPIDTHGGKAQVDPTPVLDLTMYEYGYFTQRLFLGPIPDGMKVDARIRRHKDGSSLREFTVTVVDRTTGEVVLDLIPRQTGLLPSSLFWDLRLTNRLTREVRTMYHGTVTVIQQVGVDEAVGQIGLH